MKLTLIAVNYRAIGKNSLSGSVLRGAVDLITPGGMRLKGALWHEAHGDEWVSPPAIPWTDDTGKKHWRSVIEWETPEASFAFQSAALEAIHRLLEKAAGEKAAVIKMPRDGRNGGACT